MAKEIERKFLVSSDAWRSRVERSISIRQFYLAVASDRSVRIRVSDRTTATLTMKFGSHLPVRDEFEYEIPLQDAMAMMEFATGAVVDKTRHHVRHQGYLYEVDVFGGELEGLIVAELETPDIVPASDLPTWLGREVTGDQRYSNALLALSERTPQMVLALAG